MVRMSNFTNTTDVELEESYIHILRRSLNVSHFYRLSGTTAGTVTPQRPTLPSLCSPKQFSCDSGECVHLDRRCDLQKDCVDGSDEKDCGRPHVHLTVAM